MEGRLVASLVCALAVAIAGCSSGNSVPCGADNQEANDTAQSARDIGTLTDDPDSEHARSLTIHSASDEDWFKVLIRDTGLGGNPVVNVTAAFSPQTEKEYSVTTFFKCSRAGSNSTLCQRGRAVSDPQLGNGCTSESIPQVTHTTDCDGSDDDGMLTIRVRRTVAVERCESYSLKISVE